MLRRLSGVWLMWWMGFSKYVMHIQRPQEKKSRNGSWKGVFIKLLAYVAIIAILFFLPKEIWNSYFRMRDGVSGFLFLEHWLPSVIIAFTLLISAILLECRAYFLHKKLA